MKRKRKRWVKTKDAEKDGKEEEKIGEGRKKQWLRGSFNGKNCTFVFGYVSMASKLWDQFTLLR